MANSIIEQQQEKEEEEEEEQHEELEQQEHEEEHEGGEGEPLVVGASQQLHLHKDAPALTPEVPTPLFPGTSPRPSPRPPITPQSFSLEHVLIPLPVLKTCPIISSLTR